MPLTFSNIQHVFRKKNELDLKEYVLCDMIYFLSGDRSPAPGWCIMSKKDISEEIGISERSVFMMIEKMIEAGFLERNPITNYLKTSIQWQQVYFIEKSEIADTMQNLQTNTAKIADKHYAKIADNNNTIDNNIDNEKVKENFYKEIIAWKEKNPGKYPKGLYEKFFDYWTEEINQQSKKKTKFHFRFQEQKFFSMGGRLCTFWGFIKEDQKQRLWELHKMVN